MAMLLALALTVAAAGGTDASAAPVRPAPAGPATAARSGRIYGPSSARLGEPVRIGATGLGRGRYVLVLADPKSVRPATCLAEMGRARTVGGRLDLVARIPYGLFCRQPDGSLPVKVDVLRGHRYRFTVCKSLRAVLCDGRYPFRTRSVRIR